MTGVDFSRRGKASKRKGANGELEVRDLLREHGWGRTHRNFMSGGAGGGDLADAIPDVSIEVKRTEACSLPAWWRQATAAARPTDAVWVVHRASQQPWMCTLLLTDTPHSLLLLSDPMVIGARDSVRSEFMHAVKASVHLRPVVVHPLGPDRTAMCTVLLTDLLEQWAA